MINLRYIGKELKRFYNEVSETLDNVLFPSREYALATATNYTPSRQPKTLQEKAEQYICAVKGGGNLHHTEGITARNGKSGQTSSLSAKALDDKRRRTGQTTVEVVMKYFSVNAKKAKSLIQQRGNNNGNSKGKRKGSRKK